MKVDKKLIKHVAEVARLNLTDDEIKEFLPQLQEVLDAFSKISDVNTDGSQPSFQPVELKNNMRKDKIESCISQKEALSLTEHKKDGYFMGPKAI